MLRTISAGRAQGIDEGAPLKALHPSSFSLLTPACSLPFFLALLLVASVQHASHAADWPQILGPQRNGQSEEQLAGRWPAAGPPVRWRVQLGQGYAGPAVVDQAVIVFHRVEGKERVEALDRQTGRRLWMRDFAAAYRGGYDPLGDTGPRCVPLVHNGHVYLYGAAGVLHCVELKSGAHRWTRDLYDDYDAPDGYFGAGSTPIAVGQRLLVNVGGSPAAGIICLSAGTGKTLWKATDEAASYSSPVSATLGGRQQVVFITRYHLLSIAPEDGQVSFTVPFGQRGPTVNGATPLVFDQQIFASASYGVGALLTRIRAGKAEQVWASDDVMSSQYTTCVYHQGYLYGTHGRSDIGVGQLRCVEAKTGKVRWSEDQFGMAHTILAGDRLLILSEEGKLVLAEASPASFQVINKAAVTQKTVRALPALSNGRLYLRENTAQGGQLLCVELQKQVD